MIVCYDYHVERKKTNDKKYAGMVELVDTLDLSSNVLQT